METELPDDALLARYQPPDYTDCFSVTVAGEVSLAEFVYAFYTAPLFRCERIILKLIGRGSSDADARRLVRNEQDTFAAWSVEGRTDNQLLMCDFQSRTRSWFAVYPVWDGVASEKPATQLCFGSAVIARAASSPGFGLLGWLHRLYSLLLLRGAVRRLGK